MSDRFEIQEVSLLPGVHVLERRPRHDDRGWFERVYDAGELTGVLGTRTIAQVNRAFSNKKGSVRGLHVQGPPSPEIKIVSCIRGAIFDVAVDLRRGSPTFARWHAVELTDGNRRSLVIPEGFAHGFQALVDDCELLYVHTAPYDQGAERGVHVTDPRLAIPWPLEVRHLSARDTNLPNVGLDFAGIVL
jgi:dTDP-4-dehydrorhamnose 3,5-epimerase